MTVETRDPVRIVTGTSSSPTSIGRGLLLTESPALARAFRRELRNCDGCLTAFDVHGALEEALVANGRYLWIAIDLDATMAPTETIRRARETWPAARLAALSCWWSERDVIARETADVVLHKPVRSAELLSFLQSTAGSAVEGPRRAV